MRIRENTKVFGVNLRELAEELGIPNVWRRWTVEGFLNEVSHLAGRRRLTMVTVSLSDGLKDRGPYLVSPQWLAGSIWILIDGVPIGRGRYEWPSGPARVPIGPVVNGQYVPAAMVLAHHVLDAAGVPCEAQAALATRLLSEGAARVLGSGRTT